VLLGLQIVSLIIRPVRCRWWFEHVECRDDTDWIKHRLAMEVDGVRLGTHDEDMVGWCSEQYEKFWYVTRGCTDSEQMVEEY